MISLTRMSESNKMYECPLCGKKWNTKEDLAACVAECASKDSEHDRKVAELIKKVKDAEDALSQAINDLMNYDKNASTEYAKKRSEELLDEMLSSLSDSYKDLFS